MSEFPTVFEGQVRTMPGEKFHISVTTDTRPFCETIQRTIPFAYKDKLKKEIDLLVGPQSRNRLNDPNRIRTYLNSTSSFAANTIPP